METYRVEFLTHAVRRFHCSLKFSRNTTAWFLRKVATSGRTRRAGNAAQNPFYRRRYKYLSLRGHKVRGHAAHTQVIVSRLRGRAVQLASYDSEEFGAFCFGPVVGVIRMFRQLSCDTVTEWDNV